MFDFYPMNLQINIPMFFLTYGSNCRIRHGESPDKHSMFEGFKIFRNKIEHQNCSIGQIAG